ncbi:hypothetical protein PCANC_01791 [Puccinia coronata f. sp. avenae]|uniref:Uncharacterized protein n=1 Tax=Puccinia coronata f. sp. avenae TaxID=200324 RepID=A0A2N5T8P4_9BASI|nr:hypothetical protein PCANC_03314 [Puccinia coronata f. sp. avenae]PLW57400.1 hypothetical protein PCANC_01791 [Puccinia coronata f. sp. avenae]
MTYLVVYSPDNQGPMKYQYGCQDIQYFEECTWVPPPSTHQVGSLAIAQEGIDLLGNQIKDFPRSRS